MSDYNGNGWGGAFGCEFLIVVLFLAMFSGNGWGGWGNNGSGQTAAETAALVQQDNLRANVANNGAKLDWNTQLTGGAVQGIERTRDAVSALDTKICQAVNNLTQQNNQTQRQIADCCCETRHQLDNQFCATNRNITDAKNDILQAMAADRLAAVTAERDNLKVALATKEAACSREEDTRTILAAIQAGRGCCNTGCNTCCNTGCCNQMTNTYQQQVITSLAGINAGVQNLAQVQQTQGTQLTAILNRVNQIPTTAA